MLYEIREYTALPGRLPTLIKRFNAYTFRLFAKHHMEVVQIGVTSVGDNAFNEVVYTMRFTDSAEMDRKWTGLLADPEWQLAVDDTEADGPLISSMRRRLVQSAAFSVEPTNLNAREERP